MVDFNPEYGYAGAGVAALVGLMLYVNKSNKTQATEVKDHVSNVAEDTVAAVKKVVGEANKDADVKKDAVLGVVPTDVGIGLSAGSTISSSQWNVAVSDTKPEQPSHYDKQAAVDTAMRAVETADKVQDTELKTKAKEVVGHAVDHVKEMFGDQKKA